MVIENTLFQHERWLYTWTSPNGQHWNQVDNILWSWKWISCIHSAKTRSGADCGSHLELLIAKFRLFWGSRSLKIIRDLIIKIPFDLNQIPYDYTVKVTNRFKGLDLVDRVPEDLWTEVHNVVQESVTKTIPKKNKCRKAKWQLSEEALQMAEERREVKGNGEGDRYTQLKAEFQRIAGEIRRPS